MAGAWPSPNYQWPRSGGGQGQPGCRSIYSAYAQRPRHRESSARRRYPAEAAHYRGSTALLHDAIGTRKKLRIGDAAMAVDPCRGMAFFSHSPLMAAPAVINTLLQRPQDSAMALQFYQDRCEHLFERFSRWVGISTNRSMPTLSQTSLSSDETGPISNPATCSPIEFWGQPNDRSSTMVS